MKLARAALGLLLAACSCSAALLCSARAVAQGLGRAQTALPGLYRVPIAEPVADPLSAAVALGYGRTEAQPGEAGAHQRLSATAALGAAPLPALQFSARLDARYDRHPPDVAGPNSGTLLSPTLAARWIVALGPGAAVGGEAGVWLPGSESLGTMLNAASPVLAAFGTWRAGPLALSGLAGYRFDRSAAARPDLDRERFGDRLALGLSDFDAAELALGAGYVLGQSRWFAEVTADLLVGSRAPPLRQDPLTVSLGARFELEPAWSVELVASACPSARPALGPNDPLVPVEPRFALLAATSFRLPWPAVAAPAPRESAAPVPAPRSPAASLELSVAIDPARPAEVAASLWRGDRHDSLLTQGSNRFLLSEIAAGEAELHVSAPGYEEWAEKVRIPATGLEHVSVELRPLLQAQIRGLVRSLAGTGLAAHIRVEPLGVDASTDTEGFFELNVSPGSYSVRVEAEGYRPQQREVTIERGGVFILNADLARDR